MDTLQLSDKTKNVNEMNLSELKNILYLNKSSNKLSTDIVNILNNRIDKIVANFRESASASASASDSSGSSSGSSSRSSTSDSNYLDDVKKLYSRNDKKIKNDHFTQTSRKLFDRMMSQAEIINNSYKDNRTKHIEKPFVNNESPVKLGERKNIRR